MLKKKQSDTRTKSKPREIEQNDDYTDEGFENDEQQQQLPSSTKQKL